MAEVEELALKHRPQLIIAGWSAYPRQLDFAEFRRIADSVGAYLMVDMAAFRRAGRHRFAPSPVPHAHVVTSTTHKTLGGPPRRIILAKDELRKKFTPRCSPASRAAPSRTSSRPRPWHSSLRVSRPSPRAQRRTLQGARIIADRLLQPTPGRPASNVVSGGTDVQPGAGWTCATPAWTASRPKTGCITSASPSTANAVPFDPRPPMVSSGVRIGTPALAARGFATPSSPRSPRSSPRRYVPTPPARTCALCAAASPPWPRTSPLYPELTEGAR